MSSSFQLNFMWRSYFCALVATIVLAAVNPFRTGQLVLFSVKYDQNWHFFEILPFVVIGAFGGFMGLFIIKWNLRVQAFRKKYLAKYPVQEVTILAFITAVVCYFNEFLRIDMTESMQILFHECNARWDNITCQAQHRTYVVFSLLAAVVIRTFLVIISYGSKVPAGIFVPSMAIGALFGRLVGTIMWALYDKFPNAAIFASCPPDESCISPGTYAFLGAGACLSGVMHITVTVVIVMYELTGALSYIVPTMIVVGVAKVITDAWGTGGIADRTITANGFPFIDANEAHDFNDVVSTAMVRDPAVIPVSGLTISELEHFITTYAHQSYPIVDSYGMLVGYVNRPELEHVISRHRTNSNLGIYFDPNYTTQESLDCSSFTNFGAITASPDTTLEVVAEMFAKLGPRAIYVEYQGQLQGMVTRKDVLRFQHRSEYLASGYDPAPAEQVDQYIWDLLVQVGIRIQAKGSEATQYLRNTLRR
jgi:chloride channel 3/4/5